MIHTISHSRIDIFLGKYLYYVSFIVWLLLLIWEIFFHNFTIALAHEPKFPTFSIQIALPAIIISHLILYAAVYKYAYRIDFDFSNKYLIFYYFRSRKITKKKITDLDLIFINWHTCLKFKDGKKIWFKANSEFLKLVSDHNLPRKWGSIAKVLMKNEYFLDSENRTKI